MNRSSSLPQSAAGLAIVAALAGAGCGPAEEPVPGPPFEVLVLDRVAGASDEDPSPFAVQRRTLRTFTDFNELASPVFRIRQGGTATIDAADPESVLRGLVIEGGFKPDLRYVVEDGVAIPRDDATLSMFSAAYQFESIFPRLVAVSAPEVGVAFETSGPVDIFFGAKVVILNEVEVSMRSRSNAFFSPGSWQFGIDLPSAGTKVSLAADARVIAHELGHGVFQVAFFGRPAERCDEAQAGANAADPWFKGRIDDELAVSGFNEGFADWISFAVTGGTNALQVLNLSDDFPNWSRRRVLVSDTFRWNDILKPDASSLNLGCVGKYCLGTLFARSLLATYLSEGHALGDEAARTAFSRVVVASIRSVVPRMREIGLPPPTLEAARCDFRGDVSQALDPPIIGPFLAAFLEGLEPTLAARMCAEFVERFQEGFPPAFRGRCAP